MWPNWNQLCSPDVCFGWSTNCCVVFSSAQALHVSDHYPVEVLLKSAASKGSFSLLLFLLIIFIYSWDNMQFVSFLCLSPDSDCWLLFFALIWIFKYAQIYWCKGENKKLPCWSGATLYNVCVNLTICHYYYQRCSEGGGGGTGWEWMLTLSTALSSTVRVSLIDCCCTTLCKTIFNAVKLAELKMMGWCLEATNLKDSMKVLSG